MFRPPLSPHDSEGGVSSSTKALAVRQAVPEGSLQASCAFSGAGTTARVGPPTPVHFGTFVQWSFDFRAAPTRCLRRRGAGWSGRIPTGPVLPPKWIRRPPRTSRTRRTRLPGRALLG